MGKIVRSIDVGYGNTKYVTKCIGTEIECDLFPSLVKSSMGPSVLAGTPLAQKIDSVTVDVDGSLYEVGKEVDPSGIARNLDDSYASSVQYSALFKGALSYMNTSQIDLLMVGLPVNTYNKQRESVIAASTGLHEVPVHGGNPGQTMKVMVNEVKVLPQPLGALYHYALPAGRLEDVKRSTNLVVDIGYHTLDWWVSTGLKPVTSRCGARPASGMGSILAVLAQRLSADEFGGKPVDPNLRLDFALRNDWTLKLYQKTVDLKKYKALIESKVEEALNEMFSKIGTTSDLDNIILAGGSAHLFKDGLKRRLEDQKAIVMPGSVYAIVKGYQAAGLAVSKGGV